MNKKSLEQKKKNIIKLYNRLTPAQRKEFSDSVKTNFPELWAVSFGLAPKG